MNKNTKAMLGLPLVRLAPFYALGLAAGYYGGTAVRAALIIAAAVMCAVFAAVFKKAVLCAVGLLAGVCLMWGYVLFYCEPVTSYADTTVNTEITVTEITYSSNGTQQVIGKIKLDGRTTKIRVFCDDYLSVGDTALADISLELPDEEYRVTNMAKGIYLSGSIEEFYGKSESVFSLSAAVDAVRERFIGQIRQLLDGDAESLSLAMFFGDKTLLSTELSEAITVSGVSHYTAVSGTHFTIFTAIILEIFAADRKRLKAIISVFLVPTAALFFGVTGSVLRAAVMMLIFSSAPLFNRRAEAMNTLCGAVLLITLVSPETVLDAGFAMSVLGVFGAAVIAPRIYAPLCRRMPYRRPALDWLVKAFTVSVCAMVCTSPVSISLFGGISLIGAVVSIIIMPLFFVGMISVLLFGFTGLELLAIPSSWIMEGIAAVIKLFGQARWLWLPLGFEGAAALAAVFVLLLVAAAFFTEYVFSFALNACGILAAVSMSISLYTIANRSEIHFVYDGTSGAAVVCMQDEAAVFICGGGGGLADELAECLRKNGIQTLRCVDAPELDYGGALALSELCGMVDTDVILCGDGVRSIMKQMCPQTLDYCYSTLNVGGTTITGAKASDTTAQADIVIYRSYTRSEPTSSAKLAVYISPSQRLLPENGVNISSDRDFYVKIE